MDQIANTSLTLQEHLIDTVCYVGQLKLVEIIILPRPSRGQLKSGDDRVSEPCMTSHEICENVF
jgi:hypothetical protein